MAMINSTKIKTIIVDLDRTLLHTDKSLSTYTLNILNKCKKYGIKIMVATARPFRTTKQYCDLIDFDAMVVSNGARIICGNQWTDYGICQQSAKHLLTALSRYPNLRITLETGDCAYSNHPIEDYETILSDDLVGLSNTEGALKILVHLDNEETLALVKQALTDDLYFTIAHGYLLQIMNASATKWNGIKVMLDICNCSHDETVYFGDDQDDIEPIKMCGLGIAVSNGIEDAKNVADYISESNDADGVAKFIEHWILKNSYNSNLLNWMICDKAHKGGAAMTVRDAKFEDMALAADIMVTSFRAAFEDFVSQETMDACTNPENCLCLLEHIYQEGKTHFLMGGDQGFLCWQETTDGAEIVAIHSLPESWGTGLGHAMLTEALKQIGDRPVYLWAFKENTRARRFYEKHGFHWDGSERISEFDGALEVRYVRNLTRKETADYLLHECGLLEELTKYGKVHPIGSYRMDMMAWNDLDLDVENEGMSLEKLYRLTSFSLEKFHPVWYEAKEEIAPDGKTVWFHGFETMITGQLWNVDIWFFDKAKIEATTNYCDSIVRQTTPEQRRQIVAIKEELIRQGIYSFETYRSIDVYRAVVELGMTTPEQFLRQYQRDDK